MANMLAGCRAELRLLLGAAGVSAFDHIPERITPPVALVEPGSPYVEEGDTFADFAVRMNVVLLVQGLNNETGTTELDQLLCDVIDAVDTWNIQQVEQPAPFDVNGATYLGARITFRTDRELTT